MAGLEVEETRPVAPAFTQVVVAEIKSVQQHPNADRLRVCQVDAGSGSMLNIVCGAPNARAGLVGVFGAPGAYVPGLDVTLKVAAIRGVESNGMLVSMREMGLGDDHTGIIELAPDAPVGKPFAELLGLDDPVIDIKVTLTVEKLTQKVNLKMLTQNSIDSELVETIVALPDEVQIKKQTLQTLTFKQNQLLQQLTENSKKVLKET